MKFKFSNVLLIIFAIVLIGIFFNFVAGALGFWVWLVEPPREVVEKIRNQYGENVRLPEEKRRTMTTDPFYSETFATEPTYRCLPSNKKPKELVVKYHRRGYVCGNELWIEEFSAGNAPFLYGPFEI